MIWRTLIIYLGLALLCFSAERLFNPSKHQKPKTLCYTTWNEALCFFPENKEP